MHQWPIFCKHRHDFPIISITCIQNYTPLFLPKQKKKFDTALTFHSSKYTITTPKAVLFLIATPKPYLLDILKKKK